MTDRRPTTLTAHSAAPDLRMELPGPNAAAIIARDEKVTSPSLTRLYPLVVSKGRGLVLEDVDGNRFLDFNAGIAVVAAGHAPPRRQRGDPHPGRRRAALLLERLLPPAYADLCEKLAAIAPMRRRQGVPVQLRHRSGRGCAQALPPPHRSPERHRLPRRVPRPLARQPVAHRQQSPSASRVRRRDAWQLPRPVLGPLRRRRPHRCRLHRAGAVQEAHRSERRRSDLRRADPGRGRLHRPAARLAGRAPRAVQPARHPARARRGSKRHRPHRHDVGLRARSRRARHHGDRQGPRQRPPAGRNHRPFRDHGLGARRPRLDVRRQPRRVRRGDRHDRPRRERSRRERRQGRQPPAVRARRAAGRAAAHRAGPRPRVDDRHRPARPRPGRRPAGSGVSARPAHADLRRAEPAPRPPARRHDRAGRHRHRDPA